MLLYGFTGRRNGMSDVGLAWRWHEVGCPMPFKCRAWLAPCTMIFYYHFGRARSVWSVCQNRQLCVCQNRQLFTAASTSPGVPPNA